MAFVNSINDATNGIFGDGSDGSVTFDGSTIILGLTPSGNAYTLNRDIYLASSTINSGVSIITNGFRVFCSGILTNNGTIKWNGNDASSNTAGGVLSNGNSTINGSGNPGESGGNGGVNAGSNGSNQSTSYGGAGGTGGTGASGPGVAGGVTAPSAKMSTIRSIPWAVMGFTIAGDANVDLISGGAGGSGGGGDAVHAGGGGGGGGGIVIVSSLFFSGTGTISANGGIGGNAVALGTNSGGGGGGGGGLVIVLSRSVLSGSVSGQTISAAGGTQGSGLGLGASGSPGSAGKTVLLQT